MNYKKIKKCFKQIEKQNKMFSELLTEKPHLLNFDIKDIRNALNKGDTYTFVEGNKIPPDNAKDAKAAIISMLVNEKITIDKISSIAEKIMKDLDNDVEIVWAAKIVPQQPENKILPLRIK